MKQKHSLASRDRAGISFLWTISWFLLGWVSLNNVETAAGFSSARATLHRLSTGQGIVLQEATISDRDAPRKRNKPKRKANKKKPRYKLNEPAESKIKSREARPVLTDFEANTFPATNRHRLTGKIDCSHSDCCCTTNENVGEIGTIRSAKSYFASPWIRQKMLRSPSDSNDDFYKVVVPSPLTAWRTQAKLVAAPKSSAWAKDGCTFGMYRPRSHEVMPIPQCAVHHPSVNRALAVLEQATSRVGVSAYDEERREGGLRYVQLQVERTTGKVCLTLVWNAESLKDAQPGLSRLVKQLNRIDPELWHSLWVNCNDGVGNNVLARNPNRWHRISGPEFLREPLPVGDKGWLYFTPLTFRQGNMDGFDVLANEVARLVPGGSKVCELYAGVGLLGITALAYNAQQDAENLKWLRCSDENPSNARCFARAVDSLPQQWVGKGPNNRHKKKESEMTIAELMQRMENGQPVPTTTDEPEKGDTTSYMVASAARALRSGQALGADVVIVDPPRKGLEPEVLEELCKEINNNQDYAEDISVLTTPDRQANFANDARCLIYVSCGFEALARDAERLLTSKGGWRLDSATGYVLFPGSDHVETLCVFYRS